MSLRNLSLKEIYRSDRDDIISEFFVPCLANCIEYSRCVERISAKSLTTIILAIGDDPDTRVRIVSGHRFGAGFDIGSDDTRYYGQKGAKYSVFGFSEGRRFQRCRKKYTQCHRWEKSQSLR